MPQPDLLSPLIARHLDEAVRTGAIAPLDTQQAGMAWFGALNEVVVRWALTGRPERLEEVYPSPLHRYEVILNDVSHAWSASPP